LLMATRFFFLGASRGAVEAILGAMVELGSAEARDRPGWEERMKGTARAFASAFVAFSLTLGGESLADARVVPPCVGCVLVPPRSDGGPMPLLVTLHGDIDHAPTTAAPWTPAIVARGWALLSIECPVAEGCDKGSFWRWNGPPTWILAQIAKVRAAYPIDDRRIFLSGWSGGASYIGWHAPELSQKFAGLVLHGGGVAPPTRECPKSLAPTYFLVGDQNPLHHLAKDLRDYFERCGNTVTWDLLPRAGHLAELASLDTAKATVILDSLGKSALSQPLAAIDGGTFAGANAPTVEPRPDRGRDSPSTVPSMVPSSARADRPSPLGPARGCSTAPNERSDALAVLSILGCFAVFRRSARSTRV
jgi:hypothetical protein